ncbi:uncharacterized protein LOC119991869 [Tripterygium wilfordii]|uniref:uncharacterized protein LOC119991869 n=1 Tax=Tripterygium wilfordii TaxID=458696 RepID=UPI0018F82558|nr:uncharacterized protein LOC119991869 [Tripterygium wilfordii]
MATARQGTLTVTEYYTKQKGFWDELIYYNIIPDCSCGAQVGLERYQQKEATMLFLMGLNECFTAVRSQILSLDPLPMWTKALAIVLHEERQLSLTHSATPSIELASAMAIKADTGKGGSSGFQGKRENLVCNYCHKQGHTVDKCYKLHGYPPGQPRRQQRPNYGSRNDKGHFANHSAMTEPMDSAPHSSQMSPDLCNQLMNFLKLNSTMTQNVGQSQQGGGVSSSSPNLSGLSHLEEDWNGEHA